MLHRRQEQEAAIVGTAIAATSAVTIVANATAVIVVVGEGGKGEGNSRKRDGLTVKKCPCFIFSYYEIGAHYEKDGAHLELPFVHELISLPLPLIKVLHSYSFDTTSRHHMTFLGNGLATLHIFTILGSNVIHRLIGSTHFSHASIMVDEKGKIRISWYTRVQDLHKSIRYLRQFPSKLIRTCA